MRRLTQTYPIEPVCTRNVTSGYPASIYIAEQSKKLHRQEREVGFLLGRAPGRGSDLIKRRYAEAGQEYGKSI